MSDSNEALQNQVPPENAGYLMTYDKKIKRSKGSPASMPKET